MRVRPAVGLCIVTVATIPWTILVETYKPGLVVAFLGSASIGIVAAFLFPWKRGRP